MDSNKPPIDSFQRLTYQRSQGLLPNLHPHWPLWDKELRQHAKVLRNNHMYMGPVRSFAHLYEAPRVHSDTTDDRNWQKSSALLGQQSRESVGIGERVIQQEDVWPL